MSVKLLEQCDIDEIYTVDVGDNDNYPVERVFNLLCKLFIDTAEESGIQEYVNKLKSYECEWEDGLLTDTSLKQMKEKTSRLKPLQEVLEVMKREQADGVILL